LLQFDFETSLTKDFKEVSISCILPLMIGKNYPIA
jgi:hypothetical protein